MDCEGVIAAASLMIPALPALIPQPSEVLFSEGVLAFNKEKGFSCTTEFTEWNDALTLLRDYLQSAGICISTEGSPITFQQDAAFSPDEDEAYEIAIAPEGIRVRANAKSGALNAVQTLRQLLEGDSLPACTITDRPRFKWRGIMLDVCRHFFPLDQVKAFIDLLALHKINRFHWHLTEDQGWRIEIKKYPRLTEVGSMRKQTRTGHASYFPDVFDGVPHGGFYTQEQIKEVVAYAAQRNITVMPEIEMPGHATAAVASYPHLSCKGNPVEVAQSWSVWRHTYCPGKRSTYEFLEGVLDEVLELFPSKYIHVGGDEAPKDYWEECPDCQRLMAEKGYTDVEQLQSHLIRHFDAYLSARGRRLIGWDEILEGGLAPQATVMSWRGEEGGIEAIKEGHDAVMAPCGWVYFDMYQSEKHKGEPLSIGGCIPWQRVYGYEPIPAQLPDDKAHHVLGAQAQLWTEYIPNIENLHYKAFPRICALSEVLWSSKEQRDEAKFRERLLPHMTRLSTLGVEGRPVDAV